MNTPAPPIAIALDTPHRFWLWAIRTWSSSHSDLTTVWWSLDRAFTNERIPAALPQFHNMMNCMFSNVRHWPQVNCVLCPRVCCDESRLLNVLAHLQLNDHFNAQRLLRHWLPSMIAGTVSIHAQRCASIAFDAGQTLTVLAADLIGRHVLHISDINKTEFELKAR
jgi:hypothetical protein